MIVVGLTGGIASGKTTATKFLKKKKMKVHDSDLVVKNIYSKPSLNFINYLKKINLASVLKENKIDKNAIRKDIFNNINIQKVSTKWTKWTILVWTRNFLEIKNSYASILMLEFKNGNFRLRKFLDKI